LDKKGGFSIMKKQPELTAQTKQNLIDAFWQIYCEKGIEKTTVKEITVKAGYNRSTFYEYFTDVYDVLEQLENSLLPGPHDLPPLRLADSADTQLPIDTFLHMYEKNRKYYVVLLGDKGDSSFQSKLKHFVKDMIKTRFITQGIVDNYELDFTLEYMLSAMIGVLSYWFSLDKIPPRDRLLELMYELTHNGVIHKLINKNLSVTRSTH
jgi:AcrR family transcriptional regulator